MDSSASCQLEIQKPPVLPALLPTAASPRQGVSAQGASGGPVSTSQYKGWQQTCEPGQQCEQLCRHRLLSVEFTALLACCIWQSHRGQGTRTSCVPGSSCC